MHRSYFHVIHTLGKRKSSEEKRPPLPSENSGSLESKSPDNSRPICPFTSLSFLKYIVDKRTLNEQAEGEIPRVFNLIWLALKANKNLQWDRFSVKFSTRPFITTRTYKTFSRNSRDLQTFITCNKTILRERHFHCPILLWRWRLSISQRREK